MGDKKVVGDFVRFQLQFRSTIPGFFYNGGSMLRGLDKRISQKTDLPVYIAEDPLRAVILEQEWHLKTFLNLKVS
jgi:hypothetical protein